MNNKGNYQGTTLSTYELSIINAKNKAVEFGLNSQEYKDAIFEMDIAYNLMPKSFTYKIINKIAKWQTKK